MNVPLLGKPVGEF